MAEAAEAVCEEPQALDSRVQLQACSIVRSEEPGDERERTRFLVRETVREFAGEQLTPDERGDIGQRHAEYSLALAEEAESKLSGEEQFVWLERLEREHDNLCAALEWCKSSEEGAELVFEITSQRYERGSIIVASNLPFEEWTSVLESKRLTGALLDRLMHRVHILPIEGDPYRLAQSQSRRKRTSKTKGGDT